MIIAYGSGVPDIEAEVNAAESVRLADIPDFAMFESLLRTSTMSLDAPKKSFVQLGNSVPAEYESNLE